MKDIVIVGSGGFAKEVGFLIEEINRASKAWNFLGYIDENVGGYNGKYKVINDDSWLEKVGYELNVVFGIGNPNLVQKLLSRFSKNENLKFPNLIHPSVNADWERIKIGRGNIICDGNLITTDITIGSFNIVNLGCTIGHDTVIGDLNVLNPSVNISGGVVISNETLIGTGVQILQYKSIGNNIVIGAGSVVTKDLTEEGVYIGIPAIKKN